MKGLRLYASQNLGFLLAIGMFVVLYAIYVSMYPSYGVAVIGQNANETMTLILVSMAQTVPVLLGGIDLSVGSLMTMVNCLASELVTGSGPEIAFGIAVCLAVGAACGFLNGCLVVYGRIQAIIATLATGAVFSGMALFLRPTPGGAVDEDLSWVLTNDINELGLTYGWFDDGALGWIGMIPIPLVLLGLLVLLVWVPFRRSVTGRGCYAIGSAAGAAYMSGVQMDRSRLAAFTLGGFFAGCGGLYLTLQMGSGNADLVQAGEYTLRSIAAVVIGGTSLFGGTGGIGGTIFGALVLRGITFIFRVLPQDSALGFIASPLLQPLFEGLILLLAVSLGAARVIRVRNRLSLFG
jgi:ribose transport system permease protein